MYDDITSGNIKANVYLSAFLVTGLFYYANPSKRDFDYELMENCHDLSLVSSPIRNRESDSHIDSLRTADREGRLHYVNCGLFSLVWQSQNRSDLNLYEAQCTHTNVPWYKWHTQIVDYGFLGKFHVMSKHMKNYDVNEEEWQNE